MPNPPHHLTFATSTVQIILLENKKNQIDFLVSWNNIY